MEKVNKSETACAKVEKEAASLKTTYDTAMRQLVEAKVAAKKALEAKRVLMEKKYRAWEECCRSQWQDSESLSRWSEFYQGVSQAFGLYEIVQHISHKKIK